MESFDTDYVNILLIDNEDLFSVAANVKSKYSEY